MSKIKIFFIPYAGGTVQIFEEVKEIISQSADCFLIDYAGHGNRAKEEFYKDWDELAADISEKINAEISEGDRIMIFGYSIGSAVVYELLARNMLNATPEHIFLASHSAPDIEWESKQYHLLSNEELVETLKPKGGFDRMNTKLLLNERFYKIFFAPLRADYDLIGKYEMSCEKILPAPTTVFFGTDDPESEQMHTWDRFLPSGSEYITFPGKHFFIREHGPEVASIILRYLL